MSCRRRSLPTDAEIAEAVHGLLGRAPDRVERLPGGANNVVARVTVEGRPLLAKVYFLHPDDPRDRVGTEFAALDFLWRRGVRCVPEPLAVDRERRLGVYEFVEGVPVSAAEISWEDALQVAELLERMWALRREPEAKRLSAASEAFFSLRAYLEGLDARLARLRGALTSRSAASAFVGAEVAPRARAVRDFVAATAPALAIDAAHELPRDQRTLSPADFGFHNVLRRADGSLVFLDFEYAGWDDPATVLAQACLTPEVPLPAAFRLPLLDELLARIDGAGLARRLRLVYPLVALKWALILLNDFVPVDSARRAFAGAPTRHTGLAQLEKSRRLLEVIDEATGPRSFLDDLVRERE